MYSTENNHQSKLGVLRRDDGAALVVTLLLLLGLAAMAAGTVMMSGTDLVVAGNDRQHQRSLDVAEAGVAEALHRLSMAPGEQVSVGGSQIVGSIFDPVDPPDLNWTTRIMLTAPPAAPQQNGSDFVTGTVQSAGQYMEYSDPADPNRAVLIEHRKADLDGDGNLEVVLYDPQKIPSENALTGEPIERVTVRGASGSASRTIMVDAIRFPLRPNVRAALLADGNVDLRGNVTVCGQNHRIDTPTGTQLPACSPAWNEVDGHLNAVMTTGSPVGTRGSTDLLGSPTATNTDPTNPFQTLAQTLGVSLADLQRILDNADHTAIDADPLDGITYIQGDVKVNGLTGTGLLYVTGDLELAGNFVWRGLIYVGGSISNTGDTWILGGVVAKGNGFVAVDFGAGTPSILYSREALNQALNQAMDYVILSWKEL